MVGLGYSSHRRAHGARASPPPLHRQLRRLQPRRREGGFATYADALRALFMRLTRDPAAPKPAPDYVKAIEELASVDAGEARLDSTSLAGSFNLDKDNGRIDMANLQCRVSFELQPNSVSLRHLQSRSWPVPGDQHLRVVLRRDAVLGQLPMGPLAGHAKERQVP